MSSQTSSARQLYREPRHVYALLLISFVATGVLFYALYLLLYPYLAIAPSEASNVAPRLALQPVALFDQIVSVLSSTLASRQGLFLFYLILLVSTFLNELSYPPLAFYHRRLVARRESIKATTLPKVSILLPAHDEERVIGTAVQTLMDLDYPRKEIIVVDDGSTDQTVRRVWPFVQSGDIRLINRPGGKKSGCGEHRNRSCTWRARDCHRRGFYPSTGRRQKTGTPF
jgi:hypothetical protein